MLFKKNDFVCLVCFSRVNDCFKYSRHSSRLRIRLEIGLCLVIGDFILKLFGYVRVLLFNMQYNYVASSFENV